MGTPFTGIARDSPRHENRHEMPSRKASARIPWKADSKKSACVRAKEAYSEPSCNNQNKLACLQGDKLCKRKQQGEQGGNRTCRAIKC